jgi:hypothetical protein
MNGMGDHAVSHARRERLRRKYLSLGSGELAAGAMFVALAVFIVSPRLQAWTDTAALWAALAPLILVLAQAAVFWLSARSWVKRRKMPPPLASLYRAFRVLDAGVLATGLVGVLTWLPGQGGCALALTGVWIFGVIEYTNYFVVRLAYPIRGWRSIVRERRQPRLIQDVNAAR